MLQAIVQAVRTTYIIQGQYYVLQAIIKAVRTTYTTKGQDYIYTSAGYCTSDDSG